MKRLWKTIALSMIISALILTSYTSQALAAPKPKTPAKFKPVEIKFGNFVPSGSAETRQIYTPFSEAVTRRTGGRLKVTLYPDGALASGPETPEAILKGKMDIGYIVGGYNPGRFPMVQVGELPGLFPTSSHLWQACMEVLARGWLDKEMGDYKVLGVGGASMYQIFSREPIRTMEDFKGKTFRVSGDVQAKTITALGGTPVLMPSPEIYTSLERGVLDAVCHAWTMGYDYKDYEVTKYVTEANLFGITAGIVMNKEKWESLPPDIQRILETTALEYLCLRHTCYWDYTDAIRKAMFLDKGLKFYYPTAEEKARWAANYVSIYKDWIADMEAKGYDAKGYLADIFDIRKEMGLAPMGKEAEILK